MANGYGGMLGQPGERESTQHGVINDITVPTLRWRGMIVNDELMIAAAMLLLPIGYTVLHKWVLPVYAIILAALLFRHALDDIEDAHDAAVKLSYAGVICLTVFAVGVLFKDIVFERLDSAWSLLWRWPPQVGAFLFKIAFLAIPFFLPVFTRTPLLTNFFKTTLRDPTWPSPRTARDVEGIQYPYAVAVAENEPDPNVYVAVEEQNEHGSQVTIGKIPDSPKMRNFARALRGGASFSKDTSKMSRKDWLTVRDEFLDRRWVKWIDPKARTLGLKLRNTGYTALLGYLDEING
jgi:hypothetical protein